MNYEKKIRRIFEELEVDHPEVIIHQGDGYRVEVVVISPSFAAMDEGDRQSLVWSKILNELTDEEQGSIDTVFTFSPAEHEAIISGSILPETAAE